MELSIDGGANFTSIVQVLVVSGGLPLGIYRKLCMRKSFKDISDFAKRPINIGMP